MGQRDEFAASSLVVQQAARESDSTAQSSFDQRNNN